MRCSPRMRSASSSVVPTGGDQAGGCHRLTHGPVETPLELQVAVSDDPHEVLIAVDDREPRDLEATHQAHRFAQGRVGRELDRVENHPALGALHPVDFSGLTIDRHVLVQHADAARTRHGDRHVRFRDRIHGCRDQRDVQLDAAGEARLRADIARMNDRMPGNEQDVVEGKGDVGANPCAAVGTRVIKTHRPAVRLGRASGP